MATGDVRIRISGTDETASAFKSVQQKMEAFVGDTKKASRTLNDLLTGGGALIAFRALERALSDVAVKFADTDASAKEFLKTERLLSESTDKLWLSVLQRFGPAMKMVADFMDPAAIAAKELAAATNEVAEAEAALAEAQKRNQGYGLNRWRTSAAEQRLSDARSQLEIRQAMSVTQAEADRPPVRMPKQSTQSAIWASQQMAYDAQQARGSGPKDAGPGYRGDAGNGVDIEAAMAQTQIDTWRTAYKAKEDAFKESQDRIGDMAASSVLEMEQADRERFELMEEQSQQFGNLFAANLVQAGENGFDGLLKQWEQTLLQMAASALAANLFKSIFPTGIAGGIGKGGFGAGLLGKLFGAKDGADFTVGGSGGPDSQFYPMMLSPGERVQITPPGQSGGGQVINITNHVNASGSDPARVAEAMRLSEARTVATIRDMQKRHR